MGSKWPFWGPISGGVLSGPWRVPQIHPRLTDDFGPNRLKPVQNRSKMGQKWGIFGSFWAIFGHFWAIFGQFPGHLTVIWPKNRSQDPSGRGPGPWGPQIWGRFLRPQIRFFKSGISIMGSGRKSALLKLILPKPRFWGSQIWGSRPGPGTPGRTPPGTPFLRVLSRFWPEMPQIPL